MPERPDDRHVLADELLRFFDGELDEDREEAIAEHLEDCEECQKRAVDVGRTVVAMRNWTARSHGEAYRVHLHEVVQRGLERAAGAQDDPLMVERLHEWSELGKGKAEAAVGIYFDAEEERYLLSSDGLEVLVRPKAGLRVRGLPEPAGERGGGGGLTASGPGSEREGAVGMGDIALTAGASQDEAEPGLLALAEAPGPGEATLQVLANRVLTVEIPAPELGRRAPLVLLIDSEQRQEPAVEEPATFRRGTLRARFEGLKPGDYLVLFEPPAAS